MNLEFQSEQYRLATLHASIAGEYRSILGMFIKEDVLFTEKLSNINPQDTTLYQSLEKLNLGGRSTILCQFIPTKHSNIKGVATLPPTLASRKETGERFSAQSFIWPNIHS
ncbi:hypothetical protein O3P69_009837 [Scylla paramamosain]|uniref:Uncharacterized protein n=1 Tax=Scylla paramamosain TaxID=85552 RepID=A0AAW0SMY9_SCYPA